MAHALTREQNEYARSVLRELMTAWKAEGRTQDDLAKAVGIDQTRISALLSPRPDVGTSMPVLLKAARLARRSEDEVARVAGIRAPHAGAQHSRQVLPDDDPVELLEAARLGNFSDRVVSAVRGGEAYKRSERLNVEQWRQILHAYQMASWAEDAAMGASPDLVPVARHLAGEVQERSREAQPVDREAAVARAAQSAAARKAELLARRAGKAPAAEPSRPARRRG